MGSSRHSLQRMVIRITQTADTTPILKILFWLVQVISMYRFVSDQGSKD